jgi:hypothetical protein
MRRGSKTVRKIRHIVCELGNIIVENFNFFLLLKTSTIHLMIEKYLKFFLSPANADYDFCAQKDYLHLFIFSSENCLWSIF